MCLDLVRCRPLPSGLSDQHRMVGEAEVLSFVMSVEFDDLTVAMECSCLSSAFLKARLLGWE